MSRTYGKVVMSVLESTSMEVMEEVSYFPSRA